MIAHEQKTKRKMSKPHRNRISEIVIHCEALCEHTQQKAPRHNKSTGQNTPRKRRKNEMNMNTKKKKNYVKRH